MEPSQYSLKYQELLRELKNTVEGLLAPQVANVWSIYGGLNRLHNCMEKIFKHGCIYSQTDQSYLNFVQGIEWLQPDCSKSYFTIDCEYKQHIPPHFKDDKGAIWLYKSLENHSLSQKLSWLLSDKTHLSSCYHSYAYLSQTAYAEATLICLRAVERNQPSLTSEINPCLFLNKTTKEYYQVHRRCASLPDSQIKKLYEETKSRRSNTLHEINIKKIDRVEKKINGKFKLWSSTPDLLLYNNLQYREMLKKELQSHTTPSTPINKKKITKLDSNLFLKKSKKPIKRVLINNQDIIEHTPPLSSSQSSGTYIHEEFTNASTKSLPATKKSVLNLGSSPSSMVEYGFLPMSGEKDYRKYPKKTFIEDGGMSVLPMATGYFPKPTKGQSLTSFLQSSQFSRANAELDRENAHFSISEAIISAMERIKSKKDLNLADEQCDESDPEIMDLKQRIRLRRRQKFAEKQRAWTAMMLSDGKTDTTTSVSPCSTTPDSVSECESSDEIDDLELNEASNLTELRGLSMSMASLFSDVDLTKRSRGVPDGASDQTVISAENVALSLISKFSEKQLPRASDLEWLVSEEDAPQALLPLPKSWPISPDDSEESETPLRGTKEWAPPRAQIIFTLHPTATRKQLMAKQNYRCAGCSMKVAPQYASKFRYCEYLGRYFCTGCHTNQLAIIPARVLQKWNFNRYSVSTFSYRLLEQMYTDPLFPIFDLNKNMGKLSRNLQFCHRYRLGLYYLKDFIFNCRFAESIKESLNTHLKTYFLTDPEIYSMEDLVNIRSGEMKNLLKYLVELCCRHTSECELCLARGFICEICNAKEVLFPWQMRIVNRCEKCGDCFHKICWKFNTPCPKCARILKRKESTDNSS